MNARIIQSSMHQRLSQTLIKRCQKHRSSDGSAGVFNNGTSFFLSWSYRRNVATNASIRNSSFTNNIFAAHISKQCHTSRIQLPGRSPINANAVRNSSSSSWKRKTRNKQRRNNRSKSTIAPQSYASKSSRITNASKSSSKPSFNNGTAAAATNKSYFHNLQSEIQIILLKPHTIPIPRWITTRSKTFNLSSCFGHVSFILVAFSYATEDFMSLRIMAVAGSMSMLVFNYFHPHGRVLWLPFKWNVVLIGVNAYRIGVIMYYKNMGNSLSEEMKEIKRDIMDVMDMFDFAKLVNIATEETFEDGDICVKQGVANEYVRLVIEGEMDCYRDGIKTYSLEKGNFISEAGLHAGLLLDGSIKSCCTIVANGKSKKVRCLRWNRSELVDLLKSESGIKRSLKAVLSWDIVRKLKLQRETITKHEVEDAELWTKKRTEQSEARYAAIVHGLLTSQKPSDSPEEMKKRTQELDHYRTIHHIDDEHHQIALTKIGWTLEEYEAGTKAEAEGKTS